jgi:hypothetical protein
MPAWLAPEFVGPLESISVQLLNTLQPSASHSAVPAILVSFTQC